MPHLAHCPTRPLWLAAVLLSVSLAACGGGGGAGTVGNGADSPSAAATPATAAASTAAATAGSSSTGTTAGSGADATAPTASSATTGTSATGTATGSGSTSSTSATPVDTLATSGSASTSTSATVGTSRILGVGSSLNLLGLADAAAAPAASTNTSTAAAPQRQFYIDSQAGSDANNGLAATASGANGPWRTLGRLLQADLRAGDAVQLACGSVWRETLRLPAGVNGTATLPIRVGAPASGCSTAPAIDGSLALAASAWRLASGALYQTTLDSAPLQVLSTDGAGTLSEAHHPNRGYLSSDAESLYLSLAKAGNVVTVNGRQVSTQLPVGSELVLPAGANLVGARVRMRTEAYVIDEAAVTAHGSGLLSLAKPSTSPLRSGWGYYLLGQLWMLDSAGEWHYDSSSRVLSLWMPDGAAPGTRVGISTLANGVDLSNRQYIVLTGLAVRRTGLGLDLRNSFGITLRNSVVEDTAETGIHGAGSQQLLVESNTLSRTGANAIDGQGDPISNATALTVRNNVIRDSGVLMNGERVLSLPRRSLAAIVGANGSTVTGNTIVNSGYIGILVANNSLVEGNFVYGSCSVQDDCAGIYTGGPNNGTRVANNTVVRSRGMTAGMPSGNGTMAQGIYVDDLGSQVLVEANTVVDADVGILLHNTNAVTVRGNRLYSNRRAQLWMQEDSKTLNANGDVFGNVIDNNQFAPTAATATALLMSGAFASTSAFAVFTGNRYYDQASGTVAMTSLPSGSRAYTWAEWQASSGAGSSQPVDVAGQAVSQRTAPGMTIASANLIGNAALASDASGWYAWNQTAPAGSLTRAACAVGYCLRYQAGGSAGVLSSPGFPLTAGTWYRLTVDVATEQDNQTVPMVVRAGGGNYAWASDRSLVFVGNRSWTRRSMVFQATQSLAAPGSSAGAVSARVDIDGIETGKSIAIANMELVAISVDPVSQLVGSLANAGATAVLANCPLTGTKAAGCTRFFNLADGQAVAWPVTVPARSALVVYAQSANASDADGDGIADAIDRCPGTTAGAGVNAQGCSLLQR